MGKKYFVALIFILAAGCGKNDSVRTVGNNPPPASPRPPVTQAPPPTYYNPPSFNPGIPPGYGPQFTPFVPIYQYYPQPVFQEIWIGWQDYCNTYDVPVYDFTTFWYDYCPQAVPYDYNYIDYSYYSWMDPYTSISPYCDPYTFWQGYY